MNLEFLCLDVQLGYDNYLVISRNWILGIVTLMINHPFLVFKQLVDSHTCLLRMWDFFVSALPISIKKIILFLVCYDFEIKLDYFTSNIRLNFCLFSTFCYF